MVHIIGGESSTEKETQTDESRRVYVSNFFSFGHLVPWGGLIDVKRLTNEDVKAIFDGRRVDLFAWPDLELQRDIVQAQALASGQMPQGTQDEHDAAFCHMVSTLVEQTTGCHVRTLQKPKPVVAGKRHVYVQLYLPPAKVVGAGGIGSVWWEITPKEIHPKPEVKA